MQVAGRWMLLSALVLPAQIGAQAALPLKHAPARTQTSINTADLMTRLYLYADDSMMGRAAGTEYNLKATAYIESEVRRLKLVPAGDSGGYFQNVPLVTRGLDATTSFSIDGTSLKPWDEFVARDPGRATRAFDGAQAVYGGVWPDSNMITPEQAAGKFVVLSAHTGPDVPQNQQINRAQILGRYRNAAGIAVVALETFPPHAAKPNCAPNWKRHWPKFAPCAACTRSARIASTFATRKATGAASMTTCASGPMRNSRMVCARSVMKRSSRR